MSKSVSAGAGKTLPLYAQLCAAVNNAPDAEALDTAQQRVAAWMRDPSAPALCAGCRYGARVMSRQECGTWGTQRMCETLDDYAVILGYGETTSTEPGDAANWMLTKLADAKMPDPRTAEQRACRALERLSLLRQCTVKSAQLFGRCSLWQPATSDRREWIKYLMSPLTND